LRLLQHEGELLEPFESEQVGSSAMPYKRNPMRAERMTSCALVIELEGNAWHTGRAQWLERTLDDSANRRLVISRSVSRNRRDPCPRHERGGRLEVREETISQHVAQAMPYLATERLLMRGVKAGGDRQALHEVIRTQASRVRRSCSTAWPRAPSSRRSACVRAPKSWIRGPRRPRAAAG